jgi:two-component system chemotaxis response regulator CheB
MTCPAEPFRLVVIGASTGGLQALKVLLAGLPAEFPLPLLAVQHLQAGVASGLARVLAAQARIRVKEADDLEPLAAGVLYLAPPDYHLLVERAGTLALSTDPAPAFARPSVDVLFESAAEAYGPGVIGVLLTGAGDDGSRGLRRIRERGGVTIVQDPREAAAAAMPSAAIAAQVPDHVVYLVEIPPLLGRLVGIPPAPPRSDRDPDHA